VSIRRVARISDGVAEVRAAILAVLAEVDIGAIFDEDSPDGWSSKPQPDVPYRGADRKGAMGADAVSMFSRGEGIALAVAGDAGDRRPI
jgi:bifunctional ADP-heptose synthase (sugar kinase/adenylyltransferase)